MEGDADGFFAGGEAMGGGAGDEAIGCCGDDFGEAGLGFRGVEATAHEVDAGGFGGGGFLGGFDVDMGEAAFAFELLEVVDRVFFAGAEHGS
ncbi:MAG: hypothetical protein RI897_3023 [Verrucomicrobiota bacterium]